MARKSEDPLYELKGVKKLSSTELEFMKFIWTHPEGVSSEAIYEHFPQARGTKSTILYNLSRKGYVQNEQKGLHHFYSAKITEAEYMRALLHQQLGKMFGTSSFERLIAAFCGKSHLTEKQIEKARALLEELENGLEDE